MASSSAGIHVSSSRHRGGELVHRVGREGETIFIFFSRELSVIIRTQGEGRRLRSNEQLVSGAAGTGRGRGGSRHREACGVSAWHRRRVALVVQRARGISAWRRELRGGGGIRARGCNQLRRQFTSAPLGKSSSSSTSSSSSSSSSSARGSSSSASLHRRSSQISTPGGTSRRE